MHIHEYEKLWLGASLLLIVGFIATITYGAVGAGVEMVSNDNSIDPNGLSDHEEFSEQGVKKGDESGTYDVYLVAQRYNFGPATYGGGITVPANSTVTFHITSRDVIHGFQLVGTNVNTMVIPGEVAVFTVEFDESGEHGIVCNEYCGANHHIMAGKVNVVPQSQFNSSSLVGENA